MPFKRHNKNEDHLPPAQRAASEETDTEGQAMKFRGAKNEDHLPPDQREATDDGSDDVEGQVARSGR